MPRPTTIATIETIKYFDIRDYNITNKLIVYKMFLRKMICSPSVAHTEILKDIFSETLGEWCRLRDLNSRPTDYKKLEINKRIV